MVGSRKTRFSFRTKQTCSFFGHPLTRARYNSEPIFFAHLIAVPCVYEYSFIRDDLFGLLKPFKYFVTEHCM